MSRLFVVETFRGDLDEVVSMLNKYGARFVFSLHPHYKSYADKSVTVVFKFDDYPMYHWWCEKRGTEPISTAEFFE